MKALTAASMVFTSILAASVGSAYTVPGYTYDDLFGHSDLVVIGTAVRPTRDTDERFTLTGVTPPMHVIGVTTDFRTLYVLKGAKRSHFQLHHYREPKRKLKENEVVLGGPGLMTFHAKKEDYK